MGKHDRRQSMKMRRRKAQRKKKLRLRKRLEALRIGRRQPSKKKGS